MTNIQKLTSTQLDGKTIILIDVSGSMEANISSKSDINRMDAACALSILAREMFSNIRIFTFSNDIKEVPNRRGFALRDAIIKSQYHGGTHLKSAIQHLNTIGYDRIIVFTDEQSHDGISHPISKKSYLINVASNQNGVGYGKWIHIDGFSESIMDFIKEENDL
jgi:hypothetical protein